MRDLRLIGVHEDGTHLLLVGEDGTRFRLPLDEALRAAARRDRPRLGQLLIEIEGGARPRDVQAMIRAGFTGLEVAERSGWTLEKIAKYEGPVLAEREHVATTARAVRLRHRGGGSGAVTLGQRVAERLATRGVDPDSVEWDSWRREGPDWTVSLAFVAGGRHRQATWSFDLPDRTVVARDDEARWLSEDEPAVAEVVPPRASSVYDVEADGGVETAHRPAREEPADLVTAMREQSAARQRRGSRRRRLAAVELPLPEVPELPEVPQVSQVSEGSEVPGVPEVPGGAPPEREPRAEKHMETPVEPHGEQVVEPHGEQVVEPRAEQVVEPHREQVVEPADEQVVEPAGEQVVEHPVESRAEQPERRDAVGAQDDEPDIQQDIAQLTEPAAAEPVPAAAGAGVRRGRTPVPSWDDIVFGATSRKDAR